MSGSNESLVTKEHKKEYNKRYYKANRESLKIRGKSYYQNNKNDRKEYQKQWRELNPDHLSQWQKSHPENIKKYTEKFCCGSAEQYKEAFDSYDGYCAFGCGAKAELVHHRDGKSLYNSNPEEVNNELSNLLPLCFPCHSSLHKSAGDRQRKMEARQCPN